MAPIQVEFTFSAESFGKAQLYIMIRYLNTGWVKWTILLAVALWLGLTFYFGGLGWNQVVNTLIWIPLFLGIWWVLFRWMSRRNFAKFAMLQHPIRYSFSDENVQLTTQLSEAMTPWNTIQKVEESRDFFLLFQSAFMASPLLKSGFKNESEMERFRQLVRSKGLFPA